jgi:hypothetical protein
MTEPKNPLTELAEFVNAATIEYRKGAEVEAKGGAVHVYAMPETPDRGKLIDVHFINVGFTELAADQDRFKRLLLAALNGHGEYTDITPERMAGGPSYIELGAWIGSQDLALRLLALGELCELWQVITPAKLGIEGPEADQLAGGGFVMAGPGSGFAELLAVA